MSQQNGFANIVENKELNNGILRGLLRGNDMSDTTPKFLNSVTEHPDVQRLIKQVIRSDEKVKQLEAENAKLKEALIEYGRHGKASDRIMCEKDKHSDYSCTCGFEQALKGNQHE